MIRRQTLDLLIQQHLLAHAERTLSDHERVGSLSPDLRSILEAMISVMHDEHRIALEDMMLLPFEATARSLS